MTEWYYAKGSDRLGPVDAAQLRAKWDGGELDSETLVWREGMAAWQPLRAIADEISAGDAAVAPAEEFVAPIVETASPYAAPATITRVHAAPVQGGDVVMAGFLKRLAAASIDGIILGIASYAILIVGMLVIGGAGALNPTTAMSDLASGMIGVTAIFAVYGVIIGGQAAYYGWMQASGSQATLGKMAVGIKVTRGDGSAMSLGRSLGRWAAYFFLGLVTCNIAYLVSAFTAGLTDRKQGLHDMMVDTLVVDKWAFTAHPERQRRELGAVVWIMLGLVALMVLAYIGIMVFAIAMGAAGSGH